MLTIVHYDDDIFYLHSILKRLADGIQLELDPSLFLNKILDEITFVSRSIEYFLESLQSSRLKVNRLNHLKNMFTLNQSFVGLLNSILAERVPFSRSVKKHFPHLASLRDRHLEHENALKDALSAGENPYRQENEVLTEEEYKILFSPDEHE